MFMEMSLAEMISLGGYAVLAILAIINTILRKSKKGKVCIEDTITTLEEILNTFIPNAMIEAESSGMTGSAKKLFVLSRVVIECASKGLDYQANAKTFEETIERLITLSKEVNKRSDSQINVF